MLQPDFTPGFVATVDWYRVKIPSAIEAPSGQSTADECVDLSTIDNPFCADTARAANGRFPGSISLVTSTQINVAEFSTQGIDFTINYHGDLNDWFNTPYGTREFQVIVNHPASSNNTVTSCTYCSGL